MLDDALKVLFVSSGNHGGMHHGTKEQKQSIERVNINIDVFLVKGKGLRGYLMNIIPLRKKVKKSNYDIIHAIGGHCGLLCAISLFRKKKVVSYLGSDIQETNNISTFYNIPKEMIRKLILYSSKNYSQIIVKSKKMLICLPKSVLKKANVIPNGVDFKVFKHINMDDARKKLGLKKEKRYILFLGDKKSSNKNYKLVEDAHRLINNVNVEILSPFPIEHTLIPLYLNAADLLILTSYSEGSPNVIKEAMACNCPIVSTDVGDVKENFSDIDGCLISSYEANDVATKIEKILTLNKRTNARAKISHLDKYKIAKKIIEVYENARK